MGRGISNKKLDLIKDLNRKVSRKEKRVKKNYGIDVSIPRIDPTLRGKELSEAIEKAQSFINPNNQKYQYVKNKHGVVMTKSFITKETLLNDRINRVKERELKKIHEMDYFVEGRNAGKIGSVSKAKKQHMDERYQMKFDIDMFKTQEVLKEWTAKRHGTYKGNFLKHVRHNYRRNYLEALENVFGNTSDVQKLYDKITQMDVNDFYFKSLTSEERHIDYIYEASKRDGILQEIAEGWGIDLGLDAVL